MIALINTMNKRDGSLGTVVSSHHTTMAASVANKRLQRNFEGNQYIPTILLEVTKRPYVGDELWPDAGEPVPFVQVGR